MSLPRILSLWLLGLAGAGAQVPDPSPIQRLVLDAQTVTRIPVALDRLTTVRLPSPPSDVESAGVATEPHPQALFLLSLQAGSPTFSLRALVANTNTSLNVSWRGQTYVLELFESHQPWLSVVFDAPREAALHTAGGAPRPVSPARLLGLLDTAKAYGLLRQQHPAAVAGVEVVRPDKLRDYGTYTIRTEEAIRFDAEDTLIFRLAISNKTSAVLQFIPESLMVRVGTRVYYESLTDATGTVPPQASVPVYFAVTGSADGARNALSPKNDFLILLQRIEAVAEAPAQTAAPTPEDLAWLAAPSPNAAPPPAPVTPVTPTPAPPKDRLQDLLDSIKTAQAPVAAPVSPVPPVPSVAPANSTVWQQPAPPAAAPAPVVPPPPAYTPPLRAKPFAYQKAPTYPPAVNWPATSARVPASHRARAQSFGSSVGPADFRGSGFHIQIGFGSR